MGQLFPYCILHLSLFRPVRRFVYNVVVDDSDPTTTAPQPVQPVLLSYATEPATLKPIPIWLIPLLIPAVVGSFLPFAHGVSPLTVAWEAMSDLIEDMRVRNPVLVFLAYGLWMCVPVTVMCTLLGRFPRSCRPAAIACLALAGVGIALNWLVLVTVIPALGKQPLAIAIITAFGLLLVSGCAMVIRCLACRRPMETLAITMLLAANVPMAVLCLCVFWDASPGAGYFAILFCQPAYWFLAVLTLRS